MLHCPLEFYTYLSPRSCTSFASASKGCFNSISQHISRHYWFSPPFSILDHGHQLQFKLQKLLKAYSNAENLSLTLYPHSALYLDARVTKLVANALPPSIKRLKMLRMYIDRSVERLPRTLIWLTVDGDVRNTDNLPTSLKYLNCIGAYNKPVDHLPPFLTHLQFLSHEDEECLFGEHVDNLPSTLKHLRLGTFFVNHIDYLPPMLTSLIVGDFFNSGVDYLPTSLKKLSLGDSFNMPVDNLPPSLTHLTFGFDFGEHIDHLPNSLTHLSLQGYFKTLDHLPNSLTHLSISDFYKYLDHLPTSLKSLTIGSFYRHVDHLPMSLKKLSLTKCIPNANNHND